MHRSFLVRFLLIVSLATLVWSCKKEPDLLGLDLIPESDLLNHDYIDTISIEAISVREDSLKTDELATSLLGSINDPVFGVTTASIYTQFRLPKSNLKMGQDSVVDSIILTLPYKGYYGDSLASHHIRVYELNEDLKYSSSYYQSTTLQHKPELIGEGTLVPNFIDSAYIDTTLAVPLMRIPLSMAFANRLLAANDSTLAKDENFFKEFKGLYITADDATTPGTGGLIYLNLTSEYSRIYMYYRSTNGTKRDTTRLDFKIDGSCARFTHYDHNGYEGADPDLLSQFAGNKTSAGEKLYLQSMGGSKIKLSFPYLKNFANKKIAIHEAALVFESADTATKYPVPALLGIRTIDKDGDVDFLVDETVEGSSYVGGYASDNAYRLRITRYIQNRLLNPDEEDYGLMLLVGGASLSGNRAIIKGPKASEGRMRLLLYYTPVE